MPNGKDGTQAKDTSPAAEVGGEVVSPIEEHEVVISDKFFKFEKKGDVLEGYLMTEETAEIPAGTNGVMEVPKFTILATADDQLYGVLGTAILTRALRRVRIGTRVRIELLEIVKARVGSMYDLKVSAFTPNPQALREAMAKQLAERSVMDKQMKALQAAGAVEGDDEVEVHEGIEVITETGEIVEKEAVPTA